VSIETTFEIETTLHVSLAPSAELIQEVDPGPSSAETINVVNDIKTIKVKNIFSDAYDIFFI